MKVTLLQWAAKRYDPAPPIFTLRRWARDGELGPTAEKVGKEWYVDENAERLSVLVPAGGSLLDRVKAAEPA